MHVFKYTRFLHVDFDCNSKVTANDFLDKLSTKEWKTFTVGLLSGCGVPLYLCWRLLTLWNIEKQSKLMNAFYHMKK